jgi:IclR family pca regulon transcriptional regulator
MVARPPSRSLRRRGALTEPTPGAEPRAKGGRAATASAAIEKAAESRLFVGSLAKAFQVLDAFAKAKRALRLSEVAPLAGLDRSATQRFVHTLAALGVLRQDPGSRLYSLAPRVLDFSAAFLASAPVREIALPFLEALSRRSEETVNLSELDGEDVVYIARFPSRHVVSVDLALGARLPAWCTAPGRAILAFSDEPRMRALIAAAQLTPRTPHTLTSRRRLNAAIDRARREGFALNDQEAFVGDISVAAPILGPTGAAIAAVNIAVPFPRWSTEEVRRQLAPLVIETAHRISAALQRSST